MKSIDEKLIMIVKELLEESVTEEQITNCHDFSNLGMDSLALMRLVLKCEENFNIEFSDDEMDISILCDYEKLREVLLSK